MRVTFVLPCYMWVPSGGFRVVYEYANRLVARGHQVTLVHARRLKYAPPGPEDVTLRARIRRARASIVDLIATPSIDWHPIDERVKLLFVPSSDEKYIPDGDVLFATAWQTVRSVLECAPSKGEKCYLIQHYEVWMGPKELVDETWRAPLHKVVIARWLMELGESMGCNDLSYIPNAIDSRYRVVRPIEQRRQRVVMMCSSLSFKGSSDGIKALEISKKQFPNMEVVLFGQGRRAPWVPRWMSYMRNPPQSMIIEHFYNGSSIFLGPSLAEGFPLPPAEAAACGCAIVATDIGGHRDYLENNVTALLSPPKNPEALARNLCHLLGNDDLRIRLARAVNNFIGGFSWETSADLLERFLRRVLRQERSAA